MDKTKKNKFPKTKSDQSNLMKISYFDLSPKEQKSSEKSNLIFTYSLNPHVVKQLQPNVEKYIMFIDTRRSDYYFKVKNYLEENKKKYSSYCTVGDSDIIVEYSATENGNNTFKKTILDMLNKAPFDGDLKELIQCYKVSEFIILRGTVNSYSPQDEYDIPFEERIKISLTQKNYINKDVIAQFSNKKELKIFLQGLKDKGILLGYYVIDDFLNTVLRAYILILYSNPGFKSVILKRSEIKNKIVDLYQLTPDNNYDVFYNHVNFLIVGEFSSIREYNTWKEVLYKYLEENGQKVNVMTYVVEKVISENPMSIGNLIFFEEICNKYKQKDSISIGYPYYFNEIIDSQPICINFDVLRDHGLIIGEPGQGKTYTATVLAKKLLDSGRKVHIIDSTGGIDSKFQEVYPDIYQKITQKIELEKIIDNDFRFPKENKVYFYQPTDEKLNDISLTILKSIENRENSPDRFTTDVFIFEEAHKIFENKITSKAIFSSIVIAGRKGASIWFSTQKYSSFPINSGINLASNLKNRIIHKITSIESNIVADFLNESNKECLYENIETELLNLQRGQVMVSFLWRENNSDIQLSPIKIQIDKE